MKIKNTLQLLLILLMQITFAQTENIQQIRGKITADSVAIDRINIVNVTTENATVSDANGFFAIPVKVGDILVFTAVNLETLRKKINKQDFLQEVL